MQGKEWGETEGEREVSQDRVEACRERSGERQREREVS